VSVDSGRRAARQLVWKHAVHAWYDTVSCATTGPALRGSGDGLATAHSGGNLQVI
jgi:hypothetical protein